MEAGGGGYLFLVHLAMAMLRSSTATLWKAAGAAAALSRAQGGTRRSWPAPEKVKKRLYGSRTQRRCEVGWAAQLLGAGTKIQESLSVLLSQHGIQCSFHCKGALWISGGAQLVHLRGEKKVG